MTTKTLANFIYGNLLIGTAEYNYRNGEVEKYYIFQKNKPDTEGDNFRPAMVYVGVKEEDPSERILKRMPSMTARGMVGFVFAVPDHELYKFCRENNGNIATMLNTFFRAKDLNHKAYDTLLCYLRRDFEAKRKLLESTDC